jgi:CubicO group peptidase (beta-lactamase class C family)
LPEKKIPRLGPGHRARRFARRAAPFLVLLFAAAAQSAQRTDASGWLARAGLAAPEQAALADSLRAAGFRPLSIDLYGDAASPACASTWTRERGQEWIWLQGLSAARLRDTLESLSRRGFRPRNLSATGPDTSASVFAAVLEKDSTPALALMNLDQEAFRAACDSAQRNHGILAWADAYGTAEHPFFAGIWKRNDAGIPWNYSLGDAAEALPAKMDAFAPVWVRPSLLVPVPGGRFFTLWEENSIGPWSYRAGVDAQSLGRIMAGEERKGLHPFCLSGSPDGKTSFTFLAAGRSDPNPKRWSVTGPAAEGLSPFDEYMRNLMQSNQVRAGSLAIVKDGRLVFAHGYTWAEGDYPVTQPGSLFRVASCSKPLTSMLLHRALRESGMPGAALTLQEKILGLLKPKDAAAPADPRFADVTVDDLLTHSGGWARSRENPDPVFNDYPLGSEIRNRLPEAKQDFLSYMLRQPMQFAPGSKSVYANFGFFLLGRLIETLPMNIGKSYEQIAEETLFKPLGLTRPRFGGSLMKDRLEGEVLYHTRTPYLQRGREAGGPPWVPGAYGDFDVRNMDAAGAWVLGAPDYAKVLASFDLGEADPLLPPKGIATMWTSPHGSKYLRGWFSVKVDDGAGRLVEGRWHNGLFPGTSTLVFHLPGKYSFVLFLDRDIAPPLTGEKNGRELCGLASAVARWPETDLFPSQGIAPFPHPGSKDGFIGEASGSEAWRSNPSGPLATDRVR